MRQALLLALILGACAPVAPLPASPPVSPRPQAGPALPLRLVGTEPFWGVLLKDGSLSFNAVDRGAIVAPIVDVQVARGGGAVYRTAPPNTVFPVAVRAVVTPGACSDGMSDRTYPYSATVDVDYAGASPPVTLKGCAGPESMFEPPASPPPRWGHPGLGG